MEKTQCKKISVDENFFLYGSKKNKSSKKPEKNKKKKSLKNISDINTKNVKELLLQKLRQYKKDTTRKNKQVSETPIDSKQFVLRPKVNDVVKIQPPIISQQNPVVECVPISSTPPIIAPSILGNLKEPVYGNLKNGKKPTLKQIIKTQKNLKHYNSDNNNNNNVDKIKVEIKKKYVVGQNKTLKKVGVFIKNNALRRQVNEKRSNLRNEKLRTVKNYLKSQNLIKYGSCAPNNLLRCIYDNSKLCGDIHNTNGNNLVHNYINDNQN